MILIELLNNLVVVSRQGSSARRSEARGAVSLVADESGTILVLVTIMMLVLCGFLGIVVDLGYGGVQHAMAQTAADAAALGAIQQTTSGSTVAAATVSANQLTQSNGFGVTMLTMGYLDSTGAATTDAGSVVTTTAFISKTYPTLFLRVIGLNTANVSASSNAVNNGTVPCVFCVLSGAGQALHVGNNGEVHANGGIVVNSGSNGGFTVDSGGIATATRIGVVGTASIGGSVSPAPTHISAIADPLAGLILPTIPGSNGTNVSVPDGGTQTIGPGVYRTIHVGTGSRLTLSSGTYFITQSFSIDNTGIVTANNVLLYFTCGDLTAVPCNNNGQTGAVLDWGNNATTTATALTSGPYKGLLILYDRHNTSQLILGNNGGSFSGTVYAKSGALILQNNGGAFASRFIVATADIQQDHGGTRVNFDQSLNFRAPGNPSLAP